jgi:hypothetical protein
MRFVHHIDAHIREALFYMLSVAPLTLLTTLAALRIYVKIDENWRADYAVPMQHINVTSNTTVALTGTVGYALGTMNYHRQLCARRVR